MPKALPMNLDSLSPPAYEYIHYTAEGNTALDLNRSYVQTSKDFERHSPNGLWLSITGNNDWEKTCLKTNYRLDNLKSKIQVFLKLSSKILIFHTTADYDNFAKKYGYYSEQERRVLLFRWEEIIKEYQGIAVPYLNPELFGIVQWRNAWCCTSACIWDLQAVKEAYIINDRHLKGE